MFNGYMIVTLPNGFRKATDRRQAYERTLGIGLQKARNPKDITHGRPSLDGSQYIIEGNFTDEELKKDTVADLIAPIVGLPTKAVAATMKVRVFEGSWKESHEKILKFLSDNQKDWELPDDALETGNSRSIARGG